MKDKQNVPHNNVKSSLLKNLYELGKHVKHDHPDLGIKKLNYSTSKWFQNKDGYALVPGVIKNSGKTKITEHIQKEIRQWLDNSKKRSTEVF